MSDETPPEHESDAGDFTRQAEEAPTGVLRELFDFMRHTKKWWLTPIILALLVLGLFTVFGSSVVAPFIYTLF